MITPKNITIIVPCYKWGPLLAETLASLEAACMEADIESVRVQVNAGRAGQQNADEIRRELAGRRLFVVAHWDEPERLPMYRNWNACVALAETDYVHLMHDDDLLSRYFYVEMMRLSKRYPRAVIYASGVMIFGVRKEWIRIKPTEGPIADASELLAHANYFACPEMIVMRGALAKFEENLVYTADWRSWFMTSLRGQIVFSPELLVFYRTHATSTTPLIERSGINVAEAWQTEQRNCEMTESITGRPCRPTGAFAHAIAWRAMRGAAINLQYRVVWIQLMALGHVRFMPSMWFRAVAYILLGLRGRYLSGDRNRRAE